MKKNNFIQDILDKTIGYYQKDKSYEEKSIRSELEKKHPDQKEDIEVSLKLNAFFQQVRSSEQKIDSDLQTKELNQKIDFIESSNTSIFKNRKIGVWILKIAAVVLPLAIIGTLALYSIKEKPSKEQQQIISTLKGSKTKIVLEDGTTIWLNAESELKYPSTFEGKDKRVVSLTGEAFFDVARDEKKPFEVYVNGFKVNVLGTSFNVKAYPNDEKIEATLEHGKVDIERFSLDQNSEPKHIISLKPKQTIVIYKDNRVVAKSEQQEKPIKENKLPKDSLKIKEKVLEKKSALLIDNEDLEQYISWKKNKLVFRSKPLNEIKVDLERWYNIEIAFEDENLNEIECTATFTNETAEQAIQALCMASKINYKFNKNTVILSAD